MDRKPDYASDQKLRISGHLRASYGTERGQMIVDFRRTGDFLFLEVCGFHFVEPMSERHGVSRALQTMTHG